MTGTFSMECIVQCQDLDDIDDDDDVSSRNHFGALRLSRLATECYVEGQSGTRKTGGAFYIGGNMLKTNGANLRGVDSDRSNESTIINSQ